ncbi:MAG: GatB/YqeY domain-containing protein [Sneathiella sp.]
MNYMLRTKLKDSLKEAMKSKNKRKTSTLRLILATLKDRDIAGRDKGSEDGINDEEILQMLTTMVRQRRESIKAYEEGGRIDLATSEKEEIEIISEYLPKQFGEVETKKAVEETIAEIGAEGLKDMGKTMGALKAKYAGRMDFSKANAFVKATLSA